AGNRQAMEHAALRGAGAVKKQRSVLPHGRSETSALDLPPHDRLQRRALPFRRGDDQLEVEVLAVDQPESHRAKQVQAGEIAAADFENARGRFLAVKVAPEMFDRGKQRQRFAADVKLPELFQTGLQQVGINRFERVAHSSPTRLRNTSCTASTCSSIRATSEGRRSGLRFRLSQALRLSG